MYHSVWKFLKLNNSVQKCLVLLKADLENVFIEVGRSVVLEIVKEKFAKSFNWVNCSFGKKFTLNSLKNLKKKINKYTAAAKWVLGAFVICFLFLKLPKVADRVLIQNSLELNIWYGYDGALDWPYNEVRIALKVIDSSTMQTILCIQLFKYEVFEQSWWRR